LRSNHNVAPACLGGLIGLAVFLIGVGPAWVNPIDVEPWLVGDWLTHYLGWHVYRAAPWTLPFGANPSLQWPIGTSVGLTDSIPVFAFFFKLLHEPLPRDFQYLGLWLLVCYTLQGAFGALLVALVTPRRALQAAGALLFMLAPPFVARFGHPALSAHWLILAALWLYFGRAGAASSTRGIVAWAVLVAVAAATHPYLAMMVLTFAAAAAARQVIADTSLVARAAAHLFVLIACAGLVLWQSAYFIHRSSDALLVGGFGEYSLNLLGLISPAGGKTRSAPGPFSVVLGQEFEGYSYLGAGLLLLTVAGVATLLARLWRRRPALNFPAEHVPFLIACALLTLFALSPVITLGNRSLLTYDPAWWGPFGVFRASGRMFWPVFYTIVFGILVLAIRRRAAVATTLLGIAAALQVIDVAPVFTYMQEARNQLHVRNTFPSPFWQVVPQHYQHLVLYKTNLCVPDDYVGFTRFSIIAGHHGLTINGGTAARLDSRDASEYCARLTNEIETGQVSPDTLYVIQPRYVAPFIAHASGRALCVVVDEHSACVARDTFQSWHEAFDIMTTSLVPLEELVDFYRWLDDYYAGRLGRAERTVARDPRSHVTLLARYLWYRRSGCDRSEAASKTAQEARGEKLLRICGDPFTVRAPLPLADETLQVWQQIHRMPPPTASNGFTTHVDLEGEVVWLQKYIEERLNGRDAHGARVEVQNRLP
jgi:hypothetical protein